MCFIPQTCSLFSVYFLWYVYVFNSIRPKKYFHKYFNILMGVCGMRSYVHMFEKPVSYHHQHLICTYCLHFQGRNTLQEQRPIYTQVFQMIYFSFLSVFISFSFLISALLISFMHIDCPTQACLIPSFLIILIIFSTYRPLNNVEYQVVFFYSDFHVPYNTNKKIAFSVTSSLKISCHYQDASSFEISTLWSYKTADLRHF